MKMFKSTFILFGVFVAIFTYVYFVEYKLSEKEQEQKINSEKLINIKQSDVKKISIIKNNDKKVSIVLQKNTDDTWMLIEPVNKKADAFVVNNMFTSLNAKTNIIIKAENKDGYNLQAYGLDKPQLTINIEKNDNTSIALFIGDSSPVKDNRYVMLKDSKTILSTGGTIFKNFDKTQNEIRDKMVFEMNRYDIENINIIKKESKISIKKTAPEQWELVNPIKEKADTNSVNSVINKFAQLFVVDFVGVKNKKQFKLDVPDVTVEFVLKDKDGKITNNKFYYKGEYLCFDGEKEIFKVSKSSFDDLMTKTAEDFKDKEQTEE